MDFGEISQLVNEKKFEEAKAKLGEFISSSDLSSEQIDAQLFLVQIHMFNTEFREAKEILLRIMGIDSRPELLPEIVQAYSLFGNLCMKSGSIEEGISRLSSTQELVDRLDPTIAENNTVVGQLKMALGTLYSEKGDRSQSIEFLEEALQYLKKAGDPVQYSRALYNISTSYSQQGDYEKAMGYLNLAIPIQQETGNLMGLAYSKMAMGEMYQRQGQLDKAFELFKEEYDIFMEHGSIAQQGWALTDMGNILLLSGRVNEAIEYLLKGLPIYEQIGQTRTLANHLRAIANAYRLKGEYIISLNFNQQAREFYQELENKTFEEKALIAIAKDFLSLGNIDKSLEMAKLAYELSLATNVEDDILLSLHLLVKIGAEQGNLEMTRFHLKKMEDYLNEATTPFNKHLISISQSVYYKARARIPDLYQAFVQVDQLLSEDLTDIVNHIDSLLIKADLLMMEMQLSFQDAVLADFRSVVEQLMTISSREHLIPLQVSSGILWSRVLLLEGKLDEAESQLSKVYNMAKEKEIDKLVRISELERRSFEERKAHYRDLLAQNRRQNLISESQIRHLISKIIVDADLMDTEEANPVYFILLSPEGKALYSKGFDAFSMDEQLVGGFLTALQSFAGETFVSSGSLERISFQEYNLLLKYLGDYNVAFIYSGSDLSAMTQLDELIDVMRSDQEIIQELETALKTSTMLNPKMMEHLFTRKSYSN